MQDKKCEEILEYYVRYLATDERSALLVANYTAALSSEKQIDVYSDFLKTVDGRELRKEYLTMAHEAGLLIFLASLSQICYPIEIANLQKSIRIDRETMCIFFRP